MAGSAYRSELWGVVLALRALCQFSIDYDSAGAITHWADNRGVVTLLQQRANLSTSQWRRRPCRDLWAEILGRLRFWERRGGSWSSSWVKGHVDATSKPLEQYTVAERLNIHADAVCTDMVDKENAGDPVRLPPAALVWAPGGRWRGKSPHTGLWSTWWDNLDTALRLHQQGRSFHAYWRDRAAARGATDAAAHPTPALDTRLFRAQKKVHRLTSDMEVFRSKLWWDHLPSQGVRARGCTVAEREAMRCNLCGRAGAGSTWHILAECLTPALITVRSKGASELGKHASEIWRTVGAEGPCPQWDRAYTG